MNTNARMFTIQLIFISLALVYLSRLFYIQIVDSTSASEIRKKEIPAPRGLILDRNGEVLVANQPMYDLMFISALAEPLDTFRLCQLLSMDREDCIKKFKKAKKHPYNPMLFKRQLDFYSYAKLQEILDQFPGFYAETQTERIYPHGNAAHVLGYIGKVDSNELRKDLFYTDQDVIGKTGLEKTYEAFLRGEKGEKWLLFDVHNRAKGKYKEGKEDVLPVPGSNIKTSLDHKLQNYGEALMLNKKGSVVALEPATGEILAYISSPGFDPEVVVGGGRGEAFEKLKQDTLDPLFNRPVMAMYPPGSTFKTIMALIGLEENVVGKKGRFKCKGTKKIPGMVACHDHEKIKGVKGAIRYSCNNYFSILMKDFFDLEKFDKASEAYNIWYSYVASFGLGARIAKEFEYESKGNLPRKEYYDGLYKPGRWKAPTIISLSVGQGELLMTPIQIANVFSAIANKGYFISPHLIKQIDGVDATRFVDLDTNYIDIKSEHFNQVINGLEEVVKQGTAVGSKIKDISMCGKTGTAENPHGEDHSVFAAFAPKSSPKIAIAVFVENSGFGSTWAAPIASLMIEKYISGEIKGSYRKQLEKKMLEGRLINTE